MSLRVLIVDDEAPARRKMRRHLEAHSDLDIAGEADNGPAAVDAVLELAPDLVFLDIQMPGMNGFDVIASVGPDRMPPVIFVTAHDEYALAAFEVETVDYLLKPVSEVRFERALARARERVAARAPDSKRLERLLAGVRPEGSALRRMVVKEHDRLLLVDVGDVVHFKTSGNYVELNVAGRRHLVRDTMDHLEGRLDPQRFARIHRTAIVNVAHVRELRPQFHGDYEVVLTTGECLRMSRRYKDRLLDERSG